MCSLVVPWHRALTKRISSPSRRTNVEAVSAPPMEPPSTARSRAGTQCTLSGFQTPTVNTWVYASRRGQEYAEGERGIFCQVLYPHVSDRINRSCGVC